MEYNRLLAQIIQVQNINISLFKKKISRADYADTHSIDHHIYPSNLFYPPD